MPDLHATVTLFNALDHGFHLSFGAAKRLGLTDDECGAVLDYICRYRIWRRPTLHAQATGPRPALPSCLAGAFGQRREVAYG